jgi:hypothetical protein
MDEIEYDFFVKNAKNPEEVAIICANYEQKIESLNSEKNQLESQKLNQNQLMTEPDLMVLNENLAAEQLEKSKLKTDFDKKTKELEQKEAKNKVLNENLAAEQLEKSKLKADFDKKTKELEQKEAKNKVLNENLAAAKNKNSKYIIGIIVLAIVLAIVAYGFHWYIANKQQTTFDKQYAKLKKDLYLTPYKPNPTQIDSLVGIWSCDVGSTLVRFPPEPNKYAHNFAEFIYDTNGYFKIRRWGPKYKYEGYAQMESKDLMSIYLMKKDIIARINDTLPPKIRHSLIRLDKNNFNSLIAISVSWEHSSPEAKDDIIGVREIYRKHCSGKIIAPPEWDGSDNRFKIMKTTCGNLQPEYLPLNKLKDSILVGHSSFMKRDPITPR